MTGSLTQKMDGGRTSWHPNLSVSVSCSPILFCAIWVCIVAHLCAHSFLYGLHMDLGDAVDSPLTAVIGSTSQAPYLQTRIPSSNLRRPKPWKPFRISLESWNPAKLAKPETRSFEVA